MPLRRLFVAAIAVVLSTAGLTAQSRSDVPPLAWQPSGPRVTWKGLSFIVPPGMTGAAKGDLYEMVGLGVRGRGGNCGIIVSGEIPARSDLASYAQAMLVANLASAGTRIADSQGGSNLIADRRVGRSADGWGYVELNGMVLATDGRARIMLIDRGATVIPILAVSEPTNGCVGLSAETTPNSNTITWAAFFYSLKLAGATPSNHFREQIIGRWGSSGSSLRAEAGALSEEVYAPNGRYGGANLGQTAAGDLSSTGGGQYVVDADTLAIFPVRGRPEANLIRIVEDYSVLRPSTSTIRLCRLIVDPGGPNERCLSGL